ncbi:Uncharacterised protein [Staphylococcus petrasii]|uniref:Uncharacterized protein n=1 Tax=Staphylococcus petrasii TaxID=1276936 RepID=A0A380G3H2_9STAP|nr:hypothetical protein CD137_08755 [Staphylococcus petrasii]TGE11095.1 hypothetical protein E2557_11305 [Staphylococcus petrasii]TGE16476.1 hypothetical protein BJR09_09005 [Staphylococcus petrasii]SUM45067.1 Uncharacterised protein [Staphylococcus petrasii]
MPQIIMLIITITCILYIVYCLVKDKPIINVFLAAVVQSILLFLVRFLWIKESFSKALISSFDLLTIAVVIIYLIYKLNKRIKHQNK